MLEFIGALRLTVVFLVWCTNVRWLAILISHLNIMFKCPVLFTEILIDSINSLDDHIKKLNIILTYFKALTYSWHTHWWLITKKVMTLFDYPKNKQWCGAITTTIAYQKYTNLTNDHAFNSIKILAQTLNEY